MPKKFLLVGWSVAVMASIAVVGVFTQTSLAAPSDPAISGFDREVYCYALSAEIEGTAFDVQTLASMGRGLAGQEGRDLISFDEREACWDATCYYDDWVYIPDRGWVKVRRAYDCEVCFPIEHEH